MNSKLTCVSGYWVIKNKHDDKYNKWFANSLKIDCPYVFFGDKNSIEIIKKYRKGLTTVYIELDISDFKTFKYKDNMIKHPVHCPSVELNLVWHEKIFLINKAYKLNIFKSDYFCWIDAGICVYRNVSPPNKKFPDLDILYKLPKDKIIYSSSNKISEQFKIGNYYKYHHVSGTSYLLHKNLIPKISEIYKCYLILIDKNDIWTDQVLWTIIYENNKDLFYKISEGYGELIPKLFGSNISTIIKWEPPLFTAEIPNSEISQKIGVIIKWEPPLFTPEITNIELQQKLNEIENELRKEIDRLKTEMEQYKTLQVNLLQQLFQQKIKQFQEEIKQLISDFNNKDN